MEAGLFRLVGLDGAAVAVDRRRAEPRLRFGGASQDDTRIEKGEVLGEKILPYVTIIELVDVSWSSNSRMRD